MRQFALGLAAVLALSATAAYAHPRLVSASPAPGAVVAGSPREVRITFNETIFAKLSAVTIKTQAGAAVRTGKASVDPTRTHLVAPIIGRLAPGHYMVTWRAVSTDTHRVAGRFDFMVK